jgi:hypothetical protein
VSQGRPAREVYRALSGALEEASVEVSITSLMKLCEAIADDRRVDVGPYIG